MVGTEGTEDALRRGLIDTGAIYAFVTRNDRHHRGARTFVRRWTRRHGLFVLPDLIFAETMTLLKVRLGAAVAVRVGLELRGNPVYAWESLGAEGERDTWATFRQYADKEWSYADCALLVVARRSGISSVFAFDTHFSQITGIVTLP